MTTAAFAARGRVVRAIAEDLDQQHASRVHPDRRGRDPRGGVDGAGLHVIGAADRREPEEQEDRQLA
jgi:hypothetical protein